MASQNSVMKSVFKGLGAGLILVLIGGVYYLLPTGMTDPDLYFVTGTDRQLQPDELGQLASVQEEYFKLATTGDDFAGWDVEQMDFWKYSIAFSAYGIPSAMIIDPDNKQEYQALMDMMIWKMKSKKVWGDFTPRGFGMDPISVQNIMYKGHLNLMYGLYQLTTGDRRYAREYTWLTEQIAREMRLHHQGYYEGVTCEPNAWFPECNTIGMLSLHIYDKLYATTYTENEIQWSLDFIMDRMRDPQTGLFYRAYLPNQDTVLSQIRGYNNAWIMSFLSPFLPAEMKALYPVYKQQLTGSLGPYASALLEIHGEPDEIALVFAMWAAKEFNDPVLFGKLRNTIDKFGDLSSEKVSGGLNYSGPHGKMVNGVVLSSKMHVGWNRVLNHDWGQAELPYDIPEIQGMTWKDLLPDRIYARSENLDVPPSSGLRPCPSCFWGDYQSVRTQLEHDASQQVCPPAHVGSCGLPRISGESGG